MRLKYWYLKGLVASSGSKLAACKDLVIHGGRLRRWMLAMEDWKQFTKRKVFTGDFWHPIIPLKNINQPHLPYQNKVLLRHLQATCSRAFKLPSTAFYDTTLLIYRRASNKNQELFLVNLYRREHSIKIRKFTPSHINSIYMREPSRSLAARACGRDLLIIYDRFVEKFLAKHV